SPKAYTSPRLPTIQYPDVAAPVVAAAARGPAACTGVEGVAKATSAAASAVRPAMAPRRASRHRVCGWAAMSGSSVPSGGRQISELPRPIRPATPDLLPALGTLSTPVPHAQQTELSQSDPPQLMVLN